MKELLDKLSSYHLFNYLLPGILFVVLAKKLTHFSFMQEDIIIGVFVYYFIGLVISRVGSLIIEPLLKHFKFVRFADYKDFFAASRVDPQIEVLSEANNSYRTLCSTFAMLLLLKVYDGLETAVPRMANWDMTIALVFLVVMFLFAYRKQTAFILKRIDTAKER